jgi:hypothetical protein
VHVHGSRRTPPHVELRAARRAQKAMPCPPHLTAPSCDHVLAPHMLQVDQLLMYQHMGPPLASGGASLMPLHQQLGGLSLGPQNLPGSAVGSMPYGMAVPGMLHQQPGAMPDGMMVGAGAPLAQPTTAAMHVALGQAGLPMGDGSGVPIQGLTW